jgi:hypothetical protein
MLRRKQAEDLSDQARVPNTAPSMTLEQRRDRVGEEREQHAVGLGDIEGALKARSG